MPLKKKFAIILLMALSFSFICELFFLRLTLSYNIFINDDSINDNYFPSLLNEVVEEGHLNVSGEELLALIMSHYEKEALMKNILHLGIKLGLLSSFFLFTVLLTALLFAIDRIICRPLSQLNKAIYSYNNRSGYYTAHPQRNEIKHLSDNFYLMSEQIEASKQKKDELISYISHDLKTPLTSISGYTQRLINPGISDPKKRQRYYETILSKANEIKVMVDELDSYILGEIEEAILKPVPIKAFLQHIINEYQEELLTYNIHLNSLLDLDPSLMVPIDEKQFVRIFANIFSNAVAHGGGGMQITFLASCKHNLLTINIENDGEEIPLEAYDKIFELMYQADPSRSTSTHTGKGLGLTIVKQLLLKHHGDIHAYRPKDGGFGLEIQIKLTY